MSDANTTTQEVPAVTSEDQRLINLLKQCEKQYPVSLNATRNEVTVEVKPVAYPRSDKKEAGCKFLGINPDLKKVDNIPMLVQFIGAEKALSALWNILNQVFQAATENAVESGSLNVELFLKGAQEFSARGEPSTELKERSDEASVELNEFLTNPAIQMTLVPNTPNFNKANFDRFLELSSELAYCQAELAKRKRGPRGEK